MKATYTLIFLCVSTFVFTQNVGVGTSSPHPSAKLDITSTDSGILIPRVDTSSIAAPAEGLLTYDPVSNRFYFYNGGKWLNVANTASSIMDSDGDTRIETESTPDNDEIKFYTEDIERMKIRGNRLEFPGFETYVGTESGGNNTGDFNTMIGNKAGKNSIEAVGNSFLGASSGFSNEIGDLNVYIGFNSGSSGKSANENCFVGFNSGFSSINGSKSIILGASAGVRDSLILNSVYLGYKSGHLLNLAGRTGNIFLGYQSGMGNTESNRLIIENSESTSPLIYGQFDDDQLTINGNLGIGVKEPNNELEVEDVDGSGDVLARFRADGAEVLIGYNQSNQGIVGTQTNHDLRIRTNGNTRMTIKPNGNVGIGTTNPSHQLQLSSNSAAKPVSSSWLVVSDDRLKKDVRTFKDGLNIIEKINPVWFTYTGRAGLPSETGVGAIAQEIETIAPYMTKTWVDENSSRKDEYLSVDYGAMDFILINAIKEQQILIKKLEKRIAKLEKQ